MIAATGSDANTIIPIVVATACSLVVIFGTMRTWLRGYVDDRADARAERCVTAALVDVLRDITALKIDMAVVKRDRQRRGQP